MKYPWKRFWCPRDGVVNLSDGGFLYDPESEYAEFVQSDVVPFEKIAHLPCLALLGEPGIGKSTAMDELQASLAERLNSSGNTLLYLNLNEYADESRLIGDLFGCEKFAKWKQSNYVLHLFLDSLDECHIQILQIATILNNHLRGISENLRRLSLRIACRTADWPPILEQALPQLWGKDRFGAYELSPLRRGDVEEASRMQGLDTDKFMAEIERTETPALACKPATLNFLISIFRKDGKLPSTRSELYEQGCKRLCEELNPNRLDLRAAGGAGMLSAEERLNVASRIAAVSVFCRKPRIFTGIPTGLLNMEQIAISELAGVEVVSPAKQWQVSEAHIRETLGTGLFSSRGTDFMGFAHQTYGEFFAARYLHSHNVAANKMLAILRHPGDSEAHIVPQLYETAAWIASQNREVFSVIARNEPHILLRCDEGALSPEQRAELTESYLESLHEGRADRRDWSLYRHYHKLSHSGTHDQLYPWITDDTGSQDARDAAIDIAECCKVTSLQSTLTDLALDEDQAEYLRSNAVHAVAVVGDQETRMQLRPLALGEAGDDPQDQLKGNALRALWPGLITAQELFGCLTLPKRDNFFGAYRSFVDHELVKHLDSEGLPFALRWLEAHAQQLGLGFPFHRLADDIIVLAWKHMGTPRVLDALAKTSIELMKHHHGLVSDHAIRTEYSSLFDDAGKRHRLVEAMVRLAPSNHIVFGLFGIGNSLRLLRDVDFDWCMQELIDSLYQPTEPTWAKLAWRLFIWTEPSAERLDQLIAARAKSPELAAESESFFTPVELASEDALRMKQEYEESQKWQQPKEKKLLDWLPKDRIEHWLTRCENGEQNAWWLLLRQLTLEDTSEEYEHMFAPDIRRLPGWLNSDDNTRNRILDAAENYLNSKCPFDQARLLDGSADEQDIAGYKAFLLLMNERSDNLLGLREDVWAYWTPVFFGPFGHNGDREIQERLIAIAYQKVAENVISRLKEIIRHEITKEDRYVSVLGLVENMWDQRIADAVRAMLEEAQAKPPCWGRILHVLLTHGDEGSRSLAEGRLLLPLPPGENDRAIVLQAALVMMNSKDDAAWPLIWPILQAEGEFGRDLIEESAHELHHNPNEFLSKLTEDSVANLFIWLVRQFPYEEDVQYNGVHSPTREDEARELRNRAINFLEKIGTPASCQAIQRIVQILPELAWLKVILVEARKNTLQLTWRPLRPPEFLDVTSQPKSVLIRDATELQVAMIDALHTLEQFLQGETPAAPDLWDGFRPKDENHLSDWIKRNIELRLCGRGIVAAREVQIRRGEGSGTGERTDIHVTAMVPALAEGTYEQVRVIVEAKGCWNQELESAMKSQLVGRYLEGNQCTHGIYLVGWYVCDQWDKDDRRRSGTPKWSLLEARQFFENQAQVLSACGLSIRAVVLNAALR